MKKRIFYIAPKFSSFVKNDIKLLSNEYIIKVNILNWRNKILVPFNMLFQILYLLFNLKRIEIILISSGGYWSFIPSLMGKLFKTKVFIILNGSDCASIPPLNYGNLRKSILKYCIKISYLNAERLLPVSSSLAFIKNTYYSDDQYSFQGFKHFFPKLNTKYTVVHNGLDYNFWKPIAEYKKEAGSFISVFSGDSQFILKGGDLIFEIAKKFPNCKFYLAGIENVQINKPENVELLGRLDKYELLRYYNLSEFYMQLSIFEGFGVALCEAMLCECIPIGSSVNIIPEIIADSGYILNKRNINELESLLNEALESKDKSKLKRLVRQRIKTNYSNEKRLNKIVDIIEK